MEFLTSMRCLLGAEKCSHIQYPFFHRRIRENSITTEIITYRHVYGYYKCYEDMLSFYSNQQIEEEYVVCINDVMDRIYNAIRNKYEALNDVEKMVFNSLNDVEKRFFFLIVDNKEKKKMEELCTQKIKRLENSNRQLDEKNRQLELQNKYLCDDNNRLLTSYTYKIGNLILFIPKKIKRTIEFITRM